MTAPRSRLVNQEQGAIGALVELLRHLAFCCLQVVRLSHALPRILCGIDWTKKMGGRAKPEPLVQTLSATPGGLKYA